ncbi:uncharacterized protein K452DRAFT_357804 [Aplosporella prunicola CBS 121167]|uniref:RWD domain-containing protein n=1 Tax=Aplosporella prunicola CBS 121167 TaxID=1176127 RepID=A0A6A6BKX5_9PEZI|nr:uncharacterized protein K452DRAFT_357804 [Aplosporella prunicola CBS 121167]KAF2143507.1 hypothetical protein K452DRAFT_357804 [Aplosporella prunicola CBS 121167]
MADTEENRERQLNEITLLETMYPEEIRIIKNPQGPDEDFELEIQLDTAHSLSFVLPWLYPTSSPPHVFVSFGPGVQNDDRKQLRARLREIVDRQVPGIECVDLIVGDFKQALEDFESDRQAQAAQHAAPRPTHKTEEAEGLRVVLWMHHLLATSKRRAIVQLSKELSLAGYSKPGYPGSVYVEGEASNVRSFVDELKSMRWQAIQERASEVTPVPALTLISSGQIGVEEVQGLGDIVENLKSRGDRGPEVATFYVEGMRIK